MILSVPQHCDLGGIDVCLSTLDLARPEGFFVEIAGDGPTLHPLVYCLIAAQAEHAKRNGLVVELSGDTAHGGSLHRMGLLHHFAIEPLGSQALPDPTGKYIPVTHVHDRVSLNAFASDFIPILHASKQTSLAVTYVVHELVRNVLEHAGPSGGAYVSADLLEDGTVRVGVADAGIGVPPAIRRSHAAPTDVDALRLAFSPGVSGVSKNFGGNDTNGGAGLFFMRSMSRVSRRPLVMVTASTLMRLEPLPSGRSIEVTNSLDDDIITWAQLPLELAGTSVGVDLALGDEIQYRGLLASIGKAYHASLKTKKDNIKRARFR